MWESRRLTHLSLPHAKMNSTTRVRKKEIVGHPSVNYCYAGHWTTVKSIHKQLNTAQGISRISRNHSSRFNNAFLAFLFPCIFATDWSRIRFDCIRNKLLCVIRKLSYKPQKLLLFSKIRLSKNSAPATALVPRLLSK